MDEKQYPTKMKNVSDDGDDDDFPQSPPRKRERENNRQDNRTLMSVGKVFFFVSSSLAVFATDGR